MSQGGGVGLGSYLSSPEAAEGENSGPCPEAASGDGTYSFRQAFGM